jgi:uncharacterized protein (TIGR03083 family)
MTELNAERARQAIVEHTRRLAESAAAAGPDAAVPTSPEWTIADLVEHVGQTQHWVAETIERRITDPAQLPREMAVLPADPRKWQAWLSESARRVASACSDDALDAPVFNPAGDERPGTRFWMSSALNEAVVHGFDAAIAANAANAASRPADIDADAGAWFIERRPDGATWQPGTRQADVTVTGPARSLLLVLTRRLALTDREATAISVDGDAGLAQHWLDNTAHVSG